MPTWATDDSSAQRFTARSKPAGNFAPSAKADAREHSREAGAMLAREHPNLAVYVRVNAIPTE